MENINRDFIELVKAEICNTDPQLNKEKITEDRLVQILQISSKHDLTHLVASSLGKAGLLGDDNISKACRRSMMSVMYRYERMSFVENKVKELFEEEAIDFVVLKGSSIGKFYPEDWMRTRSDIDILVREDKLKSAVHLLVSKLGYKVHKENYHDVALISPENVILELHYRVVEHEANMDKVLGRVWDYVVKSDSQHRKCELQLTPEFMMFHIYAHMYYHFINGGCGLRFLVDIWFAEKALELDRNKLEKFYEEAQLTTFVRYVEKLIDVCFGQGDHDEITEMMEEYILTGGLFGSFESKIKARKTKEEAGKNYIAGRIFMSLNEMQASYPKLEKYPMLYPWYTVKRWLKIFKGGTVENAVQEIRINKNMQQDGVEDLKKLFAVLKGEKDV